GRWRALRDPAADPAARRATAELAESGGAVVAGAPIAAALQVAAAPATARAGEAIGVSVEAVDRDGAPVAAYAGDVALLPSGTAAPGGAAAFPSELELVLDGGAGVLGGVRFAASGHQTVAARLTDDPSVEGEAAVLVAAGPAAALEKTGGDGQAAGQRKVLPRPFRCRALDAFGNAVEGAAVRFEAPPGAGDFIASDGPEDAAREVATDETGTAASPAFRTGIALGEQAVAATLAGLAPVSFRLTVAELPPELGLSAASLRFAAVLGGPGPAARALTVTNRGGGALAWTASPGAGLALAVSPPGGSLGPGAQQEVQVSVDAAGLALGTHAGGIAFSAPGAAGSPRDVAVTVAVIPEPLPLELSVSDGQVVGSSGTPLVVSGLEGRGKPRVRVAFGQDGVLMDYTGELEVVGGELEIGLDWPDGLVTVEVEVDGAVLRRTFTVDSRPPEIEIAPAQGDVLRDAHKSLRVAVSDAASGVRPESVSVAVNGQLVSPRFVQGGARFFAVEWLQGLNTVLALAEDRAGHTKAREAVVLFDPPEGGPEPPTLRRLRPVHGYVTLQAGQTIAIESEAEGASAVELHVDGVLAASKSEPPFTFVHTLPGELTFQTLLLKAVAEGGLTTESYFFIATVTSTGEELLVEPAAAAVAAGSGITLTVKRKSASGEVTPFEGTVSAAATDPAFGLPQTFEVAAGALALPALTTAGSHRVELLAFDGTFAGRAEAAVEVKPAPAKELEVKLLAGGVRQGDTAVFRVRALDAHGNVVETQPIAGQVRVRGAGTGGGGGGGEGSGGEDPGPGFSFSGEGSVFLSLPVPGSGSGLDFAVESEGLEALEQSFPLPAKVLLNVLSETPFVVAGRPLNLTIHTLDEEGFLEPFEGTVFLYRDLERLPQPPEVPVASASEDEGVLHVPGAWAHKTSLPLRVVASTVSVEEVFPGLLAVAQGVFSGESVPAEVVIAWHKKWVMFKELYVQGATPVEVLPDTARPKVAVDDVLVSVPSAFTHAITITFTVKDPYGNPLFDVPLVVTVFGVAYRVRSDASGQVQVTVPTPGPAGQLPSFPGEVAIEIRHDIEDGESLLAATVAVPVPSWELPGPVETLDTGIFSFAGPVTLHAKDELEALPSGSTSFARTLDTSGGASGGNPFTGDPAVVTYFFGSPWRTLQLNWPGISDSAPGQAKLETSVTGSGTASVSLSGTAVYSSNPSNPTPDTITYVAKAFSGSTTYSVERTPSDSTVTVQWTPATPSVTLGSIASVSGGKILIGASLPGTLTIKGDATLTWSVSTPKTMAVAALLPNFELSVKSFDGVEYDPDEPPAGFWDYDVLGRMEITFAPGAFWKRDPHDWLLLSDAFMSYNPLNFGQLPYGEAFPELPISLASPASGPAPAVLVVAGQPDAWDETLEVKIVPSGGSDCPTGGEDPAGEGAPCAAVPLRHRVGERTFLTPPLIFVHAPPDPWLSMPGAGGRLRVTTRQPASVYGHWPGRIYLEARDDLGYPAAGAQLEASTDEPGTTLKAGELEGTELQLTTDDLGRAEVVVESSAPGTREVTVKLVALGPDPLPEDEQESETVPILFHGGWVVLDESGDPLPDGRYVIRTPPALFVEPDAGSGLTVQNLTSRLNAVLLEPPEVKVPSPDGDLPLDGAILRGPPEAVRLEFPSPPYLPTPAGTQSAAFQVTLRPAPYEINAPLDIQAPILVGSPTGLKARPPGQPFQDVEYPGADAPVVDPPGSWTWHPERLGLDGHFSLGQNLLASQITVPMRLRDLPGLPEGFVVSGDVVVHRRALFLYYEDPAQYVNAYASEADFIAGNPSFPNTYTLFFDPEELTDVELSQILQAHGARPAGLHREKGLLTISFPSSLPRDEQLARLEALRQALQTGDVPQSGQPPQPILVPASKRMGVARTGLRVAGEPELLPSLPEAYSGTTPELHGVQLSSGELVWTQTDLELDMPGFSWEMTRTYRSQVLYHGPLGWSWDHTLNQALGEHQPAAGKARGDAVWYDGRGRRHYFKYAGKDADGRDSWRAPAGVYAELTASAAEPATFTLETVERERWIFRATAGSKLRVEWDPLAAPNLTRTNQGKAFLVYAPLARVEDTAGNAIELRYDTSAELNPSELLRLTEVVFQSPGIPERKVRYRHDLDGRLVQVTDPTGRTVRYEHDEATGDLKAVQVFAAAAVSGAPSVRIWSYLYATSGAGAANDDALAHNLVGIVDARTNGVTPSFEASHAAVTLEYGTDPDQPSYDRVTRLTLGRPGEPTAGSFVLEYPAADQTRVREPAGAVRLWKFRGPPVYPSLHALVKADDDAAEPLAVRATPLKLEPEHAAAVVGPYTFAHNLDGELTRRVEPDGLVWSYLYGREAGKKGRSRGNLLRDQRSAGSVAHVTVYELSEDDLLLGVTTARGYASGSPALYRRGYTYYPNRLLKEEILPAGLLESRPARTATHTYLPGGRLHRTEISGGASSHTTTYGYDALGYLASTTYEQPGSSAATESFVNDARGHRTQETDENGVTTTYTMSDWGWTTRRERAGMAVQTTYDGMGDVVQEVESEGSMARTSRFIRDRLGQVLREEHPEGVVVEYTRGPLGRLLGRSQGGVEDSWTLDAEGFVLAETHAGDVTQVLSRNGAGLPLSVRTNGLTTTIEYDAFRREVRRTLPAGAEVRRGYDAEDNLRWEAVFHGSALLVQTRSYLDQEGGEVARAADLFPWTEPSGHPAAGTFLAEAAPGDDFVYATRYAGRPVVATRRLDASGRIVEEVDDTGVSTTHAYDAAGRETLLERGSGPALLHRESRYLAGSAPGAVLRIERTQTLDGFAQDTAEELDAHGRRVRLEQGSQVLRWEHAPLGTVVREIEDGVPGHREQRFDLRGRLVERRVVNPGGQDATRVVSVYDAADRVTEQRVEDLATLTTRQSERYHYLPGQRLVRRVSYGDGSYSTVEHHTTLRVPRQIVRFQQGSDSVAGGTQTVNLTLDSIGRVTGIQVTRPGHAPVTKTLSLDALGRATSITEGVNEVELEHDSLGRLVREGPVTMAYDGLGRRVGVSAEDYSVERQYDALARLSSMAVSGVARASWSHGVLDGTHSTQVALASTGFTRRLLVDSSGRPRKVAYLQGAAEKYGERYHYPLGPASSMLPERREVVRAFGNQPQIRTETYAYDSARRIRYSLTQVGNTTVSAWTTHDGAGNATLLDQAVAVQDPQGNGSSSSSRTTRAVDSMNRYTTTEWWRQISGLQAKIADARSYYGSLGELRELAGNAPGCGPWGRRVVHDAAGRLREVWERGRFGERGPGVVLFLELNSMTKAEDDPNITVYWHVEDQRGGQGLAAYLGREVCIALARNQPGQLFHLRGTALEMTSTGTGLRVRARVTVDQLAEIAGPISEAEKANLLEAAFPAASDDLAEYNRQLWVFRNLQDRAVHYQASLAQERLVAAYAYDPLDRRSRKTAGDVVTLYSYAGPAVIEEAESTGAVRRYAYEDEDTKELLGLEASGGGCQGWHYALKGLHGEAGYLLREDGQIESTGWQADAMGLGEAWKPSLELGEPPLAHRDCAPRVGWHGHVRDDETGWMYAGARYYDPGTGRFLSPDPTGPWNDALAYGNSYAYGAGNPMAFRDDGYAANLILGAIGAVVGGVIGFIAGGWEGAAVGAATGFIGGVTFGASLAVTGTGLGGVALAGGISGAAAGAASGGYYGAKEGGFTGAIRGAGIGAAIGFVGGYIGGAVGGGLWGSGLGRQAASALAGGSAGGAASGALEALTDPRQLGSGSAGDVLAGMGLGALRGAAFGAAGGALGLGLSRPFIARHRPSGSSRQDPHQLGLRMEADDHGKQSRYRIANGEIRRVVGRGRLGRFTGEWDYIIDLQGNLHIGRKHSFLSSGRPVRNAGTMIFNHRGQLLRMTNLSGHYRPTVFHLELAMAQLRTMGVDMTNVRPSGF
ncbi:MAG: hypothetical protein HY721_31290, partial [Planctomycetes bacterium]|nr:hypothetical protein [Planctomycetota bacterium]